MSDRLFVGTRKGLFTVEKRGGRWTFDEPAFLGDPVTAVLHDRRDGTLHASLNLGHFGVKMRRSDDGGKTWEEQATPAYPAQPENAPGSPWKLQLVWTLEPGGADEPGVVWAGTIPGGLFRSADRGHSWSLVKSLWEMPQRLEWMGGGYDSAGIHSIVVDPRDSRRILVAVSTGGVWESRDRGETWAVRSKGLFAEYMPPERREDPIMQDVHRMVACASDPDRMWIQHHNAMFRSIDGAASWQTIEKPALSCFGFAVAVDPKDGNTAWYVPAIKDEKRVPVGGEFAVTRTRDGGRTFDVLREGLPPAPAYDLVYRHGLDVDESGERLAMGSTTGGLWISENRGDSWQCVSAHFPPINAVRWA
jgi:hypothetical protein